MAADPSPVAPCDAVPVVPADDLFEPIFTTDGLCAATSDDAWLGAMLEFESELAAMQADLGLAPRAAADAIARATAVVRRDAGALGRRARLTGTPVAALVADLEQAAGTEAAGWVHFGATSQDVIATAAMLVARRASALVLDELDRAADACARCARAHRDTLMVGRTLLQPALPITFGLKAAGWLDELLAARASLGRLRETRLALQLGGAAGTLASLGHLGPAVSARLAARLGLAEPLLPWHTSRSRIAELASALGLTAGVADRIGLDVALLMQGEVAEAFEPATFGGGSSTMPHKRNPVGAVSVNAAARRAIGLVGVLFQAMHQEHERAAGAWQAEWQPLGELLRLAGGAVARVADILAGIEVDAARMAENLAATGGGLCAERVMLALAPDLGRAVAHRVVEDAARGRGRGTGFADALLARGEVAARLTREQVLELLDPVGNLGSARHYVDRVLAERAERYGKGADERP